MALCGVNPDFVLPTNQFHGTALKAFNAFLSSQPVQTAFSANPLELFCSLYVALAKTIESHHWQLAAANEFMDKHLLAWPNDNPHDHADGNRRRHCALNICTGQPVRNFRDAFRQSANTHFGLDFRSELHKKEQAIKGKWTTLELPPHAHPAGDGKPLRRKDCIHILATESYNHGSLLQGKYTHLLHSIAGSAISLGYSLETVVSDLEEIYPQLPALPTTGPSPNSNASKAVVSADAEHKQRQAERASAAQDQHAVPPPKHFAPAPLGHVDSTTRANVDSSVSTLGGNVGNSDNHPVHADPPATAVTDFDVFKVAFGNVAEATCLHPHLTTDLLCYVFSLFRSYHW